MQPLLASNSIKRRRSRWRRVWQPSLYRQLRPHMRYELSLNHALDRHALSLSLSLSSINGMVCVCASVNYVNVHHSSSINMPDRQVMKKVRRMYASMNRAGLVFCSLTHLGSVPVATVLPFCPIHVPNFSTRKSSQIKFLSFLHPGPKQCQTLAPLRLFTLQMEVFSSLSEKGKR